jgi:hypothetical protein
VVRWYEEDTIVPGRITSNKGSTSPHAGASATPPAHPKAHCQSKIEQGINSVASPGASRPLVAKIRGQRCGEDLSSGSVIFDIHS